MQDRPGAPTTMARGHNLFDAIRILAASLVIMGHAWPLSGLESAPRVSGITINHLGVYIFFVISGYLLSRSWNRSPRPVFFLIRRALRIFPALILVTLVTVFVLGPLVSTASAAGYWGSAQTWTYLGNVTLLMQYELPGVFADNPTTAVNGSLWSLGPEFCCYLLLVVLGVFGAWFSRIVRALVAIGIGATIIVVPFHGAFRTTMIAVVFFVLGSLLAELPADMCLPLWPAILGGVALFLFAGTAGLLVAWVVIPYVVVAIGMRSSRITGPLHRLGDPSYGMYLWAFPLQQILIAAFGPLPLAISIGVVLVGAAALGYASWHLVEKRAIGWGARLTGGKPARTRGRPEADARR